MPPQLKAALTIGAGIILRFIIHDRLMRPSIKLIGLIVLTTAPASGLFAQSHAEQQADDVRTLVSRLNLEQYKSTLRGLTQFGDRRQGTKRNRDDIDWIEPKLKPDG